MARLAGPALILAGCASGGSGLPSLPQIDAAPGMAYEAELHGMPTPKLTDLAQRSLRLYTLAHRPPASLARLRRRAHADRQTLLDLLKAEGYFDAGVRIAVDGSGESARVDLTVEAARRFVFADAVFLPRLLGLHSALPGADTFGIRAGEPARAETVRNGEDRAVAWLRDHGYPFARFSGRDAVLDPKSGTLAVTSRFEPGAPARFGPVAFRGLERVRADYLLSYRPWTPGETFSQRLVLDFQRTLAGTGLFEFVTVESAAEGQANGDAVPVTVRVGEAKARTLGAGLRYTSDGGVGAKAFVEHRNLFGANERFEITGSGALDVQELTFEFEKPQFLAHRQTLLSDLTLRHGTDEAFDETSATARLGLRRQWTDRLKLGVTGSLEAARVKGSDSNGNSFLLGLEMSAAYDASNNVLDPTSGYRASGALTPYTGLFDNRALAFTVAEFRSSWYRPFDADRRYVLALRGRLGSLFGANRDDVPAPRRLYAGGGGSVRGFEARFIGPLDAAGEPLGGRSVAELGAELRVRLWGDIGIAPFIEAGTVSESPVPDLTDGVRVGAGLGLRYYTAIGPLRADLALPLNARPEDSAYQLYISIGQAF